VSDGRADASDPINDVLPGGARNGEEWWCSNGADEPVWGLRAIDDVSIDDNDAEIIRRSRESPAAFAALFDRHAVAIHRFAARRVGDALADDLMSQTFLVAFERRSSYDLARASARPWLFGIVTHLLSRHARTEGRRWRAYTHSATLRPISVDADADRVVARVDASGSRSGLTRCLADLTTGDRDVLLLFAFAELTYDEIASALEIPVGTVRSRLHRARRQMRQALENSGTPELVEENHHG